MNALIQNYEKVIEQKNEGIKSMELKLKRHARSESERLQLQQTISKLNEEVESYKNQLRDIMQGNVIPSTRRINTRGIQLMARNFHLYPVRLEVIVNEPESFRTTRQSYNLFLPHAIKRSESKPVQLNINLENTEGASDPRADS